MCAQLRLTQAHCGPLERTMPSGASCSTSNSYAHLHGPGDRTENPGVGDSIPSLPTISLTIHQCRDAQPSSSVSPPPDFAVT